MNLPRTADIAIVGAGAAGLAAAISAGAAAQGSGARIILLESARKPGAKILVSGGGRCNVTNARVAADDFSGGPRPIIRKVLRAFDEKHTLAWFASLGVPLKLEPSGKYFPTSNQARTVLDALLRRVQEVGVHLVSGVRVTGIRRTRDGFVLPVTQSSHASRSTRTVLQTRRLIVATGGLALPKSGSDGAGLAMMRHLGHTIIPLAPALTPLVLRKGTDLGGRFAEFSGLSFDARLRLYLEIPESQTRRLLVELNGPLLFTHFGISGPAPMNLSRHWLRARLEDPDKRLAVYLGVAALPTVEAADRWLLEQGISHPRKKIPAVLCGFVPERFARATAAGISGEIPLSQANRAQRRDLAQMMTMLELPVIGTRGYAHAEATAGGVDLRELDVRTMASRLVDGLFLCGEILDVDGRIGGFNFQWAWSTGFLAGRGAVASL